MRRFRPPTLIAIVALSLLAAGCGGGGTPGVAIVATSTTAPNANGSSAPSTRAGAMLLAGRCLRQHGLANFPDPSIATSGPAKGQAVLDKGSLVNFSQSLVSSAMAACSAALAQAGVGNHATPRSAQEINDGLAFARCVRRHGIANFPDPNGQGQFNLSGTGINEHALSRAQLAAARACLAAAHGAVHIPAQTSSAGNNGQ